MRESAGEAPSGSGSFKCSFAGGSVSPASASFSRWTLILCVLNLSLPSCYNPVVGVRGHLDNSRWSHLKSVIELHLQEPWVFFFFSPPKEICIQRFWDLEHDHLILGKPHSLTMMPKSKTLREEVGAVTFVRPRTGTGWPLPHPSACCTSQVHPRFSEQGVFTWVPAKKCGSLEQWLATRHLTSWPHFSQNYIFSGGFLPATPHMTLLSK